MTDQFSLELETRNGIGSARNWNNGMALALARNWKHGMNGIGTDTKLETWNGSGTKQRKME